MRSRRDQWEYSTKYEWFPREPWHDKGAFMMSRERHSFTVKLTKTNWITSTIHLKDIARMNANNKALLTIIIPRESVEHFAILLKLILGILQINSICIMRKPLLSGSLKMLGYERFLIIRVWQFFLSKISIVFFQNLAQVKN